MRGSIKKRYKGSWSIILDLGYEPDPVTGKLQRRQKWHTVRGVRKDAEDKLTDLLKAAKDGVYVDASKTTVLEWLRDWLEKAVKPPIRRPETYRVYKNFIEQHVAKSTIAALPLQKLRTSHLERLYADSTLSPASLSVYHAVLSKAFKKAVRDRVIAFNPATDVENRPRPKLTDRTQRIQGHCWSADEARKVLVASVAAGPQMAALLHLALDTGARKSEMYGLTWGNVDLDEGTVTIARQLDEAGVEPVFGPTKTDRARTLPLNAQTVLRLREHRKHQSELKMANRTVYADFGLVFAREHAHLQRSDAKLGQPIDCLDVRAFQKVIKAAGVRRIRFHGLRHTCATLMLAHNVPVHVVAQRLGHADATMTLGVYAHVLPSMQTDAAARLGALLHG